MNYQITDEQKKQLDKIRAQIASLQADYDAIEEKDPADWKTREELQRELDKFEEEKKNIEDRNEEITNKLDSLRSQSYTDVSADSVFKIKVDGETIILSGKGNSLKNLLRQYCVNFSYLENPFKTSYTDAQKKELVESITGRSQVLNTGGANNPTPHSFEWFQKQWQHFKIHAENHIYYDLPANIAKIETVFVDRWGDATGKVNKFPFHYRDIANHISKMKSDSNYDHEGRAKKYLFNTNKELQIILPAITPVQIPSAKGLIDKEEASFKAGDYLYLLESTFPENTKGSNLLLNRGSTNTDYTLESAGPAWMKGVSFKTLGFYEWYSIDAGKTSSLNKDHTPHHWKEANMTYNKKILPNVISENKPKILKTGDGFKGAVDKFNEVFTPAVQTKFYSLYRVRSVPANDFLLIGNIKFRNPSKDSDYLTSRRLVAESFQSGDILGTIESTENIDKKIAAKKKEIADFDVNSPYTDNNYHLAVAKKRAISQQINKLRQEELKIIAGNEQELRNFLVQVERRISSGGKVSLEDYEVFDDSLSSSYYARFQEVVKERLIGEKKLDPKVDKDWNFGDSKTIKDEDKDNSLKLRSRFETAKQKRNDKMKDIGPIFLRIRTILGQAKGDPVKYVEEWVKDRRNAESAQQLLSDLNELENKNIKLSDESKEIQKVIKKSELTPKDLQGFLTELAKQNKEVLDRKMLNLFNSYRWQGTKYNEGSNFSRLATHPSNISSVADIKGGKNLFNLIKDNVDGEVAYEVIGPMLEYRFREHLKKSSSDRDKDYKKEEMLNMLNEAENYCGVTLSNITEGTKSAQDLKDELVKSIGKSKGEALGLDYSRSRELTVIMKWSNYSSEEIRDIIKVIPEEGRKEFIMNNEPSKVHQEFVNKQMEEFGIKTEADVTKIKAEDKEKMGQLDRLEKTLEKAEEKGAATEEHKKVRAAIARHKVTLSGKPGDTSGGKPGDTSGGKPGDTSGGKPGDTSGGKPGDQDSSSSQQQGDGGKEPTPWWKKAGYAAIWAPILVIGAIVGIWYFAFRKPEGPEAEEGEGGAEEAVTEE